MDYLSLVKEKKQDVARLDARMQADVNLLRLDKYVMRDSQGHIVPDIINVTLNQPALFAANVIAGLSGAVEQIVVESEDRSVDTAGLEDFLGHAFAAANSLRAKVVSVSSLNEFADIQFCTRGRTARRVLFREENGEVVPDITPWDGRWVYYEMGRNGLVWAAYSTRRNRERILREYGVKVAGKDAEVLDVWDMEHNEVWIEGLKRMEQAHPHGYVPVVLGIVPVGYGDVLVETEQLETEGESIFFLIRHIVPELNRLASILQTLNMKAVKPPVVQRRRVGGEPSEYEDAVGMGSITGMEVGEDITIVNYGDARRAAEMLYGIMSQALQKGSITDIDLGSLQFPLSAVALVTLGEGRDQVFLPRLQAKARLNQQTAEMLIRQVMQIGGTVELGLPGHKARFSTAKLGGEYEIAFQYHNKSPKTDIARLAMATQAERWLDTETILKDILQIEDWQGVLARRYYYMAEKVDPNILMHRIIMAMLDLAEKGDENAAREAKLMAARLGATLAQVKAGQIPEARPAPQERAEPPLIPLLGGRGQVGGIPASAQGPAPIGAGLEEGR